MPLFNFTAKNADGKILKGTINSKSKQTATASLRDRNLEPLVINPAKKTGMSMEIKLPGSDKVRSKDLVIFTRQFSTMISAGVPMLRSLSSLKDQTESPALKKVLDAVTADVQGGQSLSEAIGKHPQAFSQIYINMVKAGEEGGILDKVLDRLAFQQEKDATLKAKIRGAMIYPSVIGSVTLIAMFILMTFIVPKIGDILVSFGSELPIYTRILLALSNIMKSPPFLLAVAIGLPTFIILFRRYIKTTKGRYRWHSLLRHMPIRKVIITKTAIARFSRIFASLMGAGVNIVESIETTAGAIGNAVIEKELLNSSRAVQAGSTLSAELQKSPHFPPIVWQMLAVGEETGKTDTVILKIAEFYEEEVDTAVGALSSVIEPVMIVVLGGMVGLIAVSVFGPITQVSTSAGN
jgi:type IV pilus assembly protein PilC